MGEFYEWKVCGVGINKVGWYGNNFFVVVVEIIVMDLLLLIDI